MKPKEEQEGAEHGERRANGGEKEKGHSPAEVERAQQELLHELQNGRVRIEVPAEGDAAGA